MLDHLIHPFHPLALRQASRPFLDGIAAHQGWNSLEESMHPRIDAYEFGAGRYFDSRTIDAAFLNPSCPPFRFELRRGIAERPDHMQKSRRTEPC